ncbi:MAG: hypothetical protein V7784_03345 [Oceanospirillaceae bacterium]
MTNKTEPLICSDERTRNLSSLESIVYDVSTSVSAEAQKALDRLSRHSNTSYPEIIEFLILIEDIKISSDMTDSEWDIYYKYTTTT